jgi:hypothetical protein
LAAAVGNACEQLRAVKTIRPGEGFQIADQIARISREQPDRLRTDGDQLDKLAEQVRAAAQFREDRLKEYRAIAAATAQLCQAKWESDQPRLKELAGAVGRLCRTVLRNRDPEE